MNDPHAVAQIHTLDNVYCWRLRRIGKYENIGLKQLITEPQLKTILTAYFPTDFHVKPH